MRWVVPLDEGSPPHRDDSVDFSLLMRDTEHLAFK